MSDQDLATLPDGSTIELGSLSVVWAGNWNSLRDGGYVTWDIALHRDSSGRLFVVVATSLPSQATQRFAEESGRDRTALEHALAGAAGRAGLDGYREAWVEGMANAAAEEPAHPPK